ncbi:MAG: hypothetical protein BalsKO_27790 [Balneolaceae bacterium]
MIPMNSKNLTPEESLNLITKVIYEARQNFKDDGIIFILWGILLTVASLGQFILLQLEYYSINYLPYFIMPFGGLATYFYYSKKGYRNPNAISKLVGRIWYAILINVLLLGFIFAVNLQENLTSVLLILIGIGSLASGSALKDKTILISGLCINLLGLSCFFISYEYHPLINAIVGFFFTLIPGILLRRKK